jgi:hypothetical protein
MTPTPTWRVSASRADDVRVTAPNWLAALALALEQLDRDLPEAGLVVETRANDTVVASDLVNGEKYVVYGERETADA